MAASSKNAEPIRVSESARIKKAPGDRPLFFNNKGLFSDPFLTSHLPEIESKGAKDAGSKFLNTFWNEPSYEGYNDFNLAYAQMISMWDQYGDLLPTYNEAQLEERWIKPILKLLGWTYEVQDGKTTRAKRNIPDYSLFADETQYIRAKKTKTDEAYYEHVLAVADAKAWKLALDGIGRTNNNPSYQIVRYLEAADVKWGILTNGRFWRLYSTRSTSKHTTYFEIDLEPLLVKRNDESFKYFFNFFRKNAFVETSSASQSFLDVVFENGVFYAKDIEANLKKRMFEVVEGIAKGFIGERKHLSQAELKETYDHSLYYLFRLMFVLNCESKGLLAVDKTSDYYEFSLRKLITNLKEQRDGNQIWSSQYRTYGLISDLFELLANGDNRIGIHGFGSEVFASGNKTFYTKNRIQDFHLNTVLVQLACDSAGSNDELQFIDYKRISEDHLGSLFEGLLEYHLKKSDSKLVILKSGEIVRWSEASEKQKKDPKSEVIEAGEVFLASDSGERKNTGSYYTPSSIVDYICDNTLSALTAGKTNREILELRLIDPAMGSAHFLIGAVRYLEGAILENINIGDETLSEDEGERARWLVLHNCIFGIDINPLAVELAKFSLWMFTAKRGFMLEPLNDQLFKANALIDKTDKGVPASLSVSGAVDLAVMIGKQKRFDAVVGNPPYAPISEKSAFDFYSKKYLSQDYQLDLYLLFLERYEFFLKDHGMLGIIVSNTWLQSVKLRKLRSYLCSRYTWKIFLHSEDKLFDATVDTHVLVMSLGESKVTDKVLIQTLSDGAISDLQAMPMARIPKNGDPVNILSNAETSDLCASLKGRTAKVEDLFDIVTGVKPFQKGKGKPAQSAEILENKPFVCEGKKPAGNDWKPLLRGSLINRYKNLWDNDYWIKYGPWLAEPRDPKFFAAPEKIVIRQTGDSIIATIAHGGTIARDNLYLVVPKDNGPKIDLRIVLGILNSSLVDFYYYNMNPEKGEALAQVKRTHVAELPMPKFEKLSKKQTVAMSKLKKVVGLLLACKTNDPSRLSEIDELVFEIFDLSKSERKAVSQHCERFRKIEKAA